MFLAISEEEDSAQFLTRQKCLQMLSRQRDLGSQRPQAFTRGRGWRPAGGGAPWAFPLRTAIPSVSTSPPPRPLFSGAGLAGQGASSFILTWV